MSNQRATQRRVGAHRGLTLVELLLVVMVLAIAAAMAAPLVAETGATRVEAAARLLLADVQFAQSAAIAHPDQVYGLRFDPANSRYEMVQVAAGAAFDCALAGVMVNPVDQRPFVTEFGAGRAAELAGVAIDALALDGDDCLAFGPYGQTDQSTPATVTLRLGNRALTLTIDAVSGHATVN